WSKGNPVDILGDAGPDRYAAGLQAVLDDKGVDAVLALNCPTAVTDSTAAAEAVLRTIQSRQPRPVVLTSWLGERSPAKARARFAGARVPTHETPDEAARAFMHLVDHARSQRLLLQAPARPAGAAPNRAAAQAVIDRALAAGETVLGIVEAGAVLRAYGVPVIETQTAATPRDAGAIAGRIGAPVALKVLSPDISHKSDVGGVV